MLRIITVPGSLLAGANLLVFLLFLLIYQPVPSGYEGLITQRHGKTVFEVNSAAPQLVAGRELFWHYGEGPIPRLVALLNLPALAVAFAVMQLVNMVTFSLSAILLSWIFAAVFLVLSTAQWLLLGFALAVAARHLRRNVRVA